MDRSPSLRLLHWIGNKESGGEGRHSDAVAPHGQVKARSGQPDTYICQRMLQTEGDQ